MMDLHEWLTFGNTTRTHQGAEGPPRELPSLPLFTLRSLFARCKGALWRHLLATYKKENYTSRPWPNGPKTSTRATSSEEATSILRWRTQFSSELWALILLSLCLPSSFSFHFVCFTFIHIVILVSTVPGLFFWSGWFSCAFLSLSVFTPAT